MLNMPKNLQYLYLDHILVPINTRLTKNEIIDKLEKYGAKQIRYFSDGADIDQQEMAKKYEYAHDLFGSGHHRFLFTK